MGNPDTPGVRRAAEGPMTLDEALSDVSAVLLDTAPVIYHVEHHPTYFPVMASFFRIRANRGIQVITSPVTLAECLVHPLRSGRRDLIESYRTTILGAEDTEFHELGSELAADAAQVRAELSLGLLDAFQVAVARRAGCEAMLTNDAAFRHVDHPRAIILDDFVGEQTE